MSSKCFQSGRPGLRSPFSRSRTTSAPANITHSRALYRECHLNVASVGRLLQSKKPSAILARAPKLGCNVLHSQPPCRGAAVWPISGKIDRLYNQIPCVRLWPCQQCRPMRRREHGAVWIAPGLRDRLTPLIRKTQPLRQTDRAQGHLGRAGVDGRNRVPGEVSGGQGAASVLQGAAGRPLRQSCDWR